MRRANQSQTRSSFDYDVVIVGAGMVGAALALRLSARSSLNICLLERASMLLSTTTPNQRVVALGQQARNVLTELDVFQQLSTSQAYPYQSMHVWDAASHGQLHFAASDVNEPQLGFMVDAIRCNYLLQQRCIAAPKITCHFDTQLRALENTSQGAWLETSQGRINARLVVAADGANSWVRRQARIFTNKIDYQQTGIVTRVMSEKSHENCAWQRFLDTGPVAFLPLADNQCSIVWSVDSAVLAPLMACEDDEFARQLASSIENRLGTLQLLDPRQSFRLRSQRAECYFDQCVVLIGDAAHSIHPLAGQGVNLGLHDVACLSRVLSSTASEELACATTLSQYQRRRKPANEQVDRAMSLLRAAYQTSSPIWSTMRGTGMNLISRSPWMRRLLVRQALGV
ncbi:2-octaprenyl-3-methyl-6-methoxy-1,4-benzoquinol hydroxylase [Arenicella chitinivorans]|uniref:2-octaprenyl-3-methyl-6-methoxy-1,4-benzoquinol hydroxylase n=1 Tax=Arenicella chitinivorans TaxID=1329800 RepID=A0A918VK46_9GAMM|nr:FAD-dependent oxidoreductase [Arenicella chitinivorans]GHA04027.1 2-octaprenyl-3-methyl-6-methoxy-1,4-benzoquinol hydroxylase [Arenicella chitinivorans]